MRSTADRYAAFRVPISGFQLNPNLSYVVRMKLNETQAFPNKNCGSSRVAIELKSRPRINPQLFVFCV